MINTEIIFIDSEEKINRLISYSRKIKSSIVSYDLETDSKICHTANLYGIGICFGTDKGFYIPWRKQPDKDSDKGDLVWNPELTKKITDWIWELAEQKHIIGHNVIYDVLVTKYQLGIDITEKIHSDTILLKHTTDENPPHGLKECAVAEFGDWADQAQQDLKDEVTSNGGKWTKEQKDMYRGSTATLGRYCVWDVVLTLMLYKVYSQRLKDQGLEKLFYEDEVMPLYKLCTIPMKDKGIKIDKPHFEQLDKELEIELERLEKEVTEEIEADCPDYVEKLLDKEVPVKRTGMLPKYLAEELSIPLPVSKTGKVTLAAAAIKRQLEATPQFSNFYNWLLGDDSALSTINKGSIINARRKYYCNKKKTNYVFNIGSTTDLIAYFIDKKGFKCSQTTETGRAKVDATFLEEELSKVDDKAAKILEFRQLKKLKSTYVVGILDRSIDGRIYTDMLQFGTTSSRFASRNPNLNNLPAIKEEGQVSQLVLKYTNAIREGITVEKGNKMIGIDYSSLEPRVVAYVTGDPGLLDIFQTGKDFYSAIGVKQFDIKDARPFKDGQADSFPKKYKVLRGIVKAYALAVIYGATAPRISQLISKTIKEAQQYIKGYFKSFPKVKKLIDYTHKQAVETGQVKTKLGRIRHLPEIKELCDKYGYTNLLNYRQAKAAGLGLERSKLKNLLNNSVNFQIQGFAAHALNRAMIKMTLEFKKRNLDARIILPIHDEVLIEFKEELEEEVLAIAKHSMETAVDTAPITLSTEAVVGYNYADCK